MDKTISGFSKLSKEQKISWIAEAYFKNPKEAALLLKKYWNSDVRLQQLHDEFIENTITNFYLPLGIAPNFLINGKNYTLPMVVEESSVVAAASKSAKYWASRGGFKATVMDTQKIGQVHFTYKGKKSKLEQFISEIKPKFYSGTEIITRNMQQRGGGILEIELRDKTDLIPDYFQLHATFETVDSMGANFINSCLERFSRIMLDEAENYNDFDGENLNIIMSILSNYVPECLVRIEVSCKIDELSDKNITDPQVFAEKFVQAVRIAEVEPYRAVTHNKGIMNGVDAVVVATGNDFRAVEAGVHAFASKSGQYSGLSHAEIKNGNFNFWMEIPLALGTVGGLTSLHPLVKFNLQMLEKPSARELMQIVASAGLAQNFAALRSLTTTGIQEGHMKMHLNNILNQLEANADERKKVEGHFTKNAVSHSAVTEFIENLRK